MLKRRLLILFCLFLMILITLALRAYFQVPAPFSTEYKAFPCKAAETVGECLAGEAMNLIGSTPEGIIKISKYGSASHIERLKEKVPEIGSRWDYDAYLPPILQAATGNITEAANLVNALAASGRIVLRGEVADYPQQLVVKVLLARGMIDEAIEFIKQTPDASFLKVNKKPNMDHLPFPLNNALAAVCVTLALEGRTAEIMPLVNSLPKKSTYFSNTLPDAFKAYLDMHRDTLIKQSEQAYLRVPKNSVHPFLLDWEKAGNNDEIVRWVKGRQALANFVFNFFSIIPPEFYQTEFYQMMDPYSYDEEYSFWKEITRPFVNFIDSKFRVISNNGDMHISILRYLVSTRSKNIQLLEGLWPYIMTECSRRKPEHGYVTCINNLLP